MPSPKEIREANEREELIESLDDELRELYDAGEIIITGQNNGRAVVVERKTGHFVKGTARPENANDPAEVGRKTAHKRTNQWRESWQRIFGLAGEEGAVGFETLVDRLWWAVQGAPQLVECHHPGCFKKHMAVIKPDPKVMMQMVESLIGRMTHVEHGGKIDMLHELLQPQEGDGEDVGFYAINPKGEDSPEERKRILLEEGVIDAEWFEDDSVNAPDMPPPPDDF